MAIIPTIRGITMRNLTRERIKMQRIDSLKCLDLMGFKRQISMFFEN